MLQDDAKQDVPSADTTTKSRAGGLSPPSQDFAYQLRGRQVEPDAGRWLTQTPPISVPTLKQVTDIADSATSDPQWRLTHSHFLQQAEVGPELAILRQLIPARDDYPYPANRVFKDGSQSLKITPISRFLQLHPQPFGTIFDVPVHGTDGIDAGRGRVSGEVNRQRDRINRNNTAIDQGMELARAFENETPGLYHRHALNWLFFNRTDISPPRQARIWMALDMAIYTALSTAWYYKWWHPTYSRLLRPAEYARRCTNDPLSVLYDREVDDNGREENATRRPPQDASSPEGGNPGTPRHPAWPSGHSTYSAAASHILEFFFSPDTLGMDDDKLAAELAKRPIRKRNFLDPYWIALELRRLANNIGEARLWAGVHWLADHRAGQVIGRAAAQAVIAEFEKNAVLPFMPMPPVEDPPKADPFTPDAPPARPAPVAGQDTIDPAVPSPDQDLAIRSLSPT